MESVPQWVRDARVGDEVVLIHEDEYVGLKTGQAYKISGIVKGDSSDGVKNDIGFALKGVSFPAFCTGISYRLFKPVSKRGTETGMKVFREILNSAPVKQLEGV